MFKRIAIFSLAFVLLSQSAMAQIMLFVGDGCPHCAVVEEYIEENGILSQLDIEIYEVYYHPENQQLYKQTAEAVGYTGGGVPFMAHNGQYVVGDKPIISYVEGLLDSQPEVEDLGMASVVDVPDAEPAANEDPAADAEPVANEELAADEDPAANEPTNEPSPQVTVETVEVTPTLSERDAEEIDAILKEAVVLNDDSAEESQEELEEEAMEDDSTLKTDNDYTRYIVYGVAGLVVLLVVAAAFRK